GLKRGMLDSESADAPETADVLSEWSTNAGFRVRAISTLDSDAKESRWRFEHLFVLRRREEGDALEWLVVEHFKSAAQGEESRSISKPQELSEHQDWAKRVVTHISNDIGLPDAAVRALVVCAGLHDEGKKASRWQR